MKKLPVKAQASLRIGTVSPVSRIKAYTKRGSICWLASIGLMGMHVFKEATSEGSGEPAHWHSLSRAYNLSIRQAQKYMYARQT